MDTLDILPGVESMAFFRAPRLDQIVAALPGTQCDRIDPCEACHGAYRIYPAAVVAASLSPVLSIAASCRVQDLYDAGMGFNHCFDNGGFLHARLILLAVAQGIAFPASARTGLLQLHCAANNRWL